MLEYQPREAGTPEGCCLQDATRRGGLRTAPCRITIWAAAKLLFARSPAVGPNHQTPATEDFRSREIQRDPERSGCLQDRRDAAADRADAVGSGCARRTQAWRRDTASNSPDGEPATCVRCRGRFGDTRHRARASACGSGCGVAAGNPIGSRWSAPGEIGMVRTASGKNGTADPSLQGRGTLQTPPPGRFSRICLERSAAAFERIPTGKK